MTVAPVDTAPGAWRTLVRGVSLSPTLRIGLPATVVLALVATAGRAVVPVAIQRTIDDGINAPTGVDLAATGSIVAWAALAVLMTAIASGWMNWRLAAIVERALSELRVTAFRHIHDLSMLHQQTQQRGVLVSRVTTDVDEISRFMQWAGLNLITSVGQLTVASIVMLSYSWQLALVVFVVFVPFARFARMVQRRLTRAYATVRELLGRLLGVVSETVAGAAVVRAYGIESHTQQRLDTAISRHRNAAVSVGRWVSGFSASGELFGALATAGVVVVGVHLGIAGDVSAGTVVALLFLITLFVDPVLIMGEVINEGQTAVAGWRRVLDILDVEPDVADPGDDGVDLPDAPLTVTFVDVQFAYPVAHTPPPTADGDGHGDGEPAVHQSARSWALRDITTSIPAGQHVAVVGETGSGKTTYAKLLTRLMDPTGGHIDIAGVDLRTVRFASLRRQVVMIPQEGTLLAGTIASNIALGMPTEHPQVPAADGGLTPAEDDAATMAAVTQACHELGLASWLDELDHGLATLVTERGTNLSAGERQLVALARAYVADPALLVLDEATSSVDPATEVRLQHALRGLTQGRTTVTIAHRLSTAERADRILVFDQGRIVGDGSHDQLLANNDTYGRLYASWTRATSG